MHKAMEFAINRMKNKSDILIRDHGKDISRMIVVIQTVTAVERQKQLLGFGEDTYASTMGKLLSLFENFDAYLKKQMDEKNYDYVFNVPFIIGVERQRQLLAGKGDKGPDYIQLLNDYNRFKIDLKMEFTGTYPGCGSPSTEKMISRNKEDYYVSLALVNCKYQFVPAEEHIKGVKNYHFGLRYFLVQDITSGVHVERWEDDEGHCHTKTHNYTGLEIRPRAPIASFTFCEDEQDSLQFYDLHLAWSREDRKGARVFDFTRLIYSDDLNRTGAYTQKDEDAAIELEQTKALLTQYTEGVHPDTLSESAMKNMYDLTVRREELLRHMNEYEDTKKKTLIMFDAQNKNETLLDEEITIPYLHEGTADVKYKLKLKVTHDPIKREK